MKILISVDMEGVACVVSPEETMLVGPEYERARDLMTGEASAAVAGAMAAGATDIVVADAHGHLRNLLPEALPDGVQLVRGAPRPLWMLQGLAPDIVAMMLVGYHAAAGTAGGVMNHTFSGKTISAVHLNDRQVGEAGFNAALAGAWHVPVAMVSGDRALSEEVRDLLPWAELVVVKEGITSWAATSLTPAAARMKIRDSAELALRRLHEMQPLRMTPPIELRVDFFRPVQADTAAIIPGVTRSGPVTVYYTGTDMMEVNRALLTMLAVTQTTRDGYG